MTRPEPGVSPDPRQVPTTLKAPATQVGQPPAGGPWAYTDGEGQASVTDCPHEWSDERHADLHTRIEGDRVTVCLTPAAALDLARAVHRVCGLPEPILLERPEHPQPITDEWNVYLDENHQVRLFARDGVPLGPDSAREVAARLAMAADAAEAEPEPDPAEVEALTARILAVKDRHADEAAESQRIARAVLAAGYERRRP